MELRPNDLEIADRYKLMIGTIVPRPIAFVTTMSPSGIPNLAPFSFFTGIGSNPMTLLICPGNHPDGSEKDTLRNAKFVDEGGTGEFVVNVAVESYARAVAAAAEDLAWEESEFELVGLTPAPSKVVRPPRVAESPIAFECRTIEVIRTNPDQPAGGNIVVGRVEQVFVEDSLLNDRMHVDADRLAAIGRMGGYGYTTTRDRFSMPRGAKALDLDDPFEEN